MKAQEYIWPTEASPYLSSTFGETRSAHFHAGLDIKTWGREGYRVFASKKGTIYRLLVSGRGYGKAIYIKHPDNTYTVYAHLQRFNDQLQALADSIRMQNYSFEMDVMVDSLNITADQGDVIGYSGSTGIGPPHLHFEIRDSLQNPINALRTNLSVPDKIPPIFKSLIIEPLNKNSRIEGNPYSRFISPSREGNGHYNFGTYAISGKTGLAVNVYDMADKVTNNYAVYTLTLVHVTDTLFHEQLDGYSYNDASEMLLDRIAPFGSGRRGHQRLYEKDGSNNPFLLSVKPGSKITPTETEEAYTIIASDYFGNTSTAEISFFRGDTATQAPPVFNASPSEWFWNEDWISPDLKNTTGLKNLDLGIPWQSDHQHLIYHHENPIPLNITRIIPDQFVQSGSPDQRLRIKFSGDEFHDTLSVASTYQIKNDVPFITVQPQMLPAKSEFRIEFYLGDLFQADKNYRLFRWKGKNNVSYIDSKLNGRTIYAYPSGLGEFVILPDDVKPSISNFRIIKTDYGKWLGLVHVRDKLSGIDSGTAEFQINGIRGIAEYDYEEDLLIYYLPGFKPQKENSAYITVKDKAGNEAEITFNATFPASGSSY